MAVRGHRCEGCVCGGVCGSVGEKKREEGRVCCTRGRERSVSGCKTIERALDDRVGL